MQNDPGKVQRTVRGVMLVVGRHQGHKELTIILHIRVGLSALGLGHLLLKVGQQPKVPAIIIVFQLQLAFSKGAAQQKVCSCCFAKRSIFIPVFITYLSAPHNAACLHIENYSKEGCLSRVE